MKTVLLSTAAVALLVSSSFAQNLPGLLPQPSRILSPNPAGGGDNTDDEAARFDLKFSGGKVKEFVAAVAKALGKPVNVVIPEESEMTQIPAVEVSRVTVPSLFSALSNASQRQILVPTHAQSPRPSLTPNSSYQYQTVGFTFRTEETSSPDAVWTFLVTNPPQFLTQEPATPPRIVQYFPVAEYLSHFTVEDIITALESGWRLQGPAAEVATCRFHEETKLLIIAGTEAQMKLIPQVLEGLAKMLSFPRTENLPITRKAGQIILPAVKFQDVLVTEAADFIRKKSVELDPDRKGFNLVVDESDGVGERKVTLALNDVPALAALQLLVDLSGMKLEIRDHAIVLRERPLREVLNPLPPNVLTAPQKSPFAPTPAALPNLPALAVPPALPSTRQR